ncbi:MAG: polysaccharide biosynthesis tyrosine autokinase [Lachnospiraceae bacterium]
MVSVELSLPELDYSSIESYKSLRTNLQFCGNDKKVIAITSCTPNEGKSSVTMNLAVSLAEAGKKVLLVDADLRKSVLVGRMKIRDEVKGLSHFLSRQESLLDVICSTNVKNLHIIFAGPVSPNPAELLGSTVFAEMLKSLRKAYNYILIDCPPLGSVIDGAIITDRCDGSIMVIESGAISYRFARDVKRQLEKCSCPILGVVLNKMDISKQGYYGKYYGKYGKYGEYGHHEKDD